MSQTQRVSAETLEWGLEDIIGEEPFLDFTFPLDQMNGANVQLVEYLNVLYPVANLHNAENYLVVLGQVGTRMEEATAGAHARALKKMILPRFILNATLKQMREFAATPAAQNPLVTSFDQKMTAAKIADDKRAAFKAEAEKIVAAKVLPAWNKAIAELESELPNSTDDAGLWRFKGGDKAYAYFLRRYTTTDMTAQQIHEVGRREIARIEKEMADILRGLGRTEGTIQERTAQIRKEQSYPLTEAGRAQIMSDIDGIIKDAQKRSESMFDRKPKAAVVARPFPKFMEETSSANYNPPAADGSRPGVYQMPLREENMTRYGLRSIIYHETVPGHHFQIALQMENKDLPKFRQLGVFGVLSGMVEGWGLYAEHLAGESDWYKDDSTGKLGQLQYELLRARRLVTDTGFHAMKWTRQQALDLGVPVQEAERYVVYPGQACAYMVGQLKIIELREKARKALGDKFSLYQFHNTVLDTGAVPLTILERQVDAYIARTLGK
jgi:uncharacterized protein (DUF885 family)